MTGPGRLLIDTDTATDDAIALLMAAVSDRTTIELVTTVGGNVPVDRATANAAHVLDRANTECPIAEGAARPLHRPLETAEEVHGPGGLGGQLRPDYPDSIETRSAPTAIVESARAEPGEFTLVCLGPLTNIARAISREPNLGSLFESIWVMGGAIQTQGNITPTAEYNFYTDPEAASRVLTRAPVTLIEWGLAREAGGLSEGAIDRILEGRSESPYAEFFATIIPHIRSFSETIDTDDEVILADALAMALLLEPSLQGTLADHTVTVDTRDGPTRGQSIRESPDSNRSAQTTIVESADKAGVTQLITATLLDGDPHSR